jgi:hypothetical protein
LREQNWTKTFTLNHEDGPNPEELFGALGIFPSFCESKIGQKFAKCQTEPPMMGMMSGKGKRTLDDEELDLVMVFNSLSGDDKKRLMAALEQDDIQLVDAILAGHL